MTVFINVAKDDLAKLKGFSKENIKTIHEEVRLKRDNLTLILYRWRERESETAVTDYIRNLISTREGLLTFLKSFISKVLSTAGNYNDMNPDSISGLYSIEEVKTLVNVISEEEIAQMRNEEKEAISLLKNRPKR